MGLNISIHHLYQHFTVEKYTAVELTSLNLYITLPEYKRLIHVNALWL